MSNFAGIGSGAPGMGMATGGPGGGLVGGRGLGAYLGGGRGTYSAGQPVLSPEVEAAFLSSLFGESYNPNAPESATNNLSTMASFLAHPSANIANALYGVARANYGDPVLGNAANYGTGGRFGPGGPSAGPWLNRYSPSQQRRLEEEARARTEATQKEATNRAVAQLLKSMMAGRQT